MNARSIILVAPIVLVASVAAHALGIVRAPSNATLGAPLNFPINVSVASDESLNSTCVTAEVYQGDQRLAPSSVRTSIEQGSIEDERVVRVYSTVAIDEPVVTVTLTLGCAVRLERRFTVFADPPLVTVAAAPEASEPARVSPAPTAAPVRRDAPASAPRADAAAGGGAAAGGTSSTTRTEKPPARPPRATATAAAPRASAASQPVRKPARTTVAAADTPTAAAPAAAASARGGAAPPARPAASGPRLQLDPVEPVARSGPAASATAAVQEAQLRVAEMAASAAIAEQAASAALANAASAAERMRALEQGLEKLRADTERDREQTAALRLKLAQAENSGRLTPWLGAVVALLVALAVWLWLRVRRLQREQQAAWWAATRGAKPPPNPPTLHPMTLPPAVAPPPLVKPEATVTVKPAMPQKPAFRDSLFASQQEPRDVSIEELIDLEQQAEFFVVLGQDDAAIDLLMGHIRSSGGTSPLPYLKLLEIYRRQGDRESYERTRERFNHRFNAYAPDWDSDLQHGRSLDEYPSVMQRMVARWREPLDAMAELEALMFRRDGGELFELPAYREVLFLYSMARDLLDHQGGPPTVIDVLLPLDDRGGQEFEPTTARPHLFTTPTGLAELSRASEPSIEMLRPSRAVRPESSEGPSSVYGAIDLDLTKPLPMDDDTQVFRREDIELRNPDQRSDFADLPPPPPPKRKS